MEERPGYYAVIPATVRYDTRVCPSARLLYGEISALTSKEGYCWASNQYFAELYEVDHSTISSWVAQLAEAGHIRTEVALGEGNRRRIWLLGEGGVAGKSRRPRREKPATSPGKAGEGSPGKAGDINTSVSTTTNINQQRLRKTKERREITDYYQELFVEEYHAKPTWDGRVMKLVDADVSRLGVEMLGKLVQSFFEEPTDFVRRNETGKGYNVFHSQIDVLLERRARRVG